MSSPTLQGKNRLSFFLFYSLLPICKKKGQGVTIFHDQKSNAMNCADLLSQNIVTRLIFFENIICSSDTEHKMKQFSNNNKVGRGGGGAGVVEGSDLNWKSKFSWEVSIGELGGPVSNSSQSPPLLSILG